MSVLFNDMKKREYCYKNLEDYSPWLSSFQAVNFKNDIEIPGQYTGKSRPIPENHTKISSFDRNVMVLTSLAMPRKIAIRGNDGKEYNFLLKPSEDLRQDNRIQQLFSVMNDIYRSDAACRSRKLSLSTYKVIPLTTRLGLIEWVDNTKTLKDFFEGAMTLEEKKSMKNIYLSYEQWICASRKNMSFKFYWDSYKPERYTEAIDTYKSFMQRVPKNLAMRAFERLSSSPEAFHTLSSLFIASHAVLSISQWVMGIGDRHLKNFLIDFSTGAELGIDFGHAFGSATQILTVPELVPFRLTAVYQNFMLPHKAKGLLEATMIHTLNALRKNHDVLLNILDVFINEPIVDWEKHAMKQINEGMRAEGTEEDTNWFPKQKVKFVQRKLQGSNPCFITREELKLGHSKKSQMNWFESICLGKKGQNERAKYPSDNLTVEQQVTCLIDQATDPSILMRIYIGWEPWF